MSDFIGNMRLHVLKLLNFFSDFFPLLHKNIFSPFRGFVTFHKQLDIFRENLNRNRHVPHALYKFNPLTIDIRVISDSARGPLNGRKKSDFLVITQSVRRDAALSAYLCYRHETTLFIVIGCVYILKYRLDSKSIEK